MKGDIFVMNRFGKCYTIKRWVPKFIRNWLGEAPIGIQVSNVSRTVDATNPVMMVVGQVREDGYAWCRVVKK